jgi:DNA-binding MarR family transcriptional regulator
MTTKPHVTKPREGIFRLIIMDIFFLAGAFKKVGNKMASKVGLTRPQWDLLINANTDQRTVPQIARRMGMARQSVQRTADILVRRGLGDYAKNPDHQRSPFFLVTAAGKDVLERIEEEAQQRRIQFMNENGVSNDDLGMTQKVLRLFREYVEPSQGYGRY